MGEDSDCTLLEAWRGGDQSAGQALLGRHFRCLYMFFSNKVSGDVGDLVQRTMLACVEGRDRVRDTGSFKAYLLGVARHQLYAHYKGKVSDPDVSVAQTPAADLGPTPTAMLASKRTQRVLLAALRRIPLELQIVLELHYWEELSTADLGQVLDIPVGTVKSRLRRARGALADQMRAAEDEGLRNTTTDDIERWAKSIREELAIKLADRRR